MVVNCVYWNINKYGHKNTALFEVSNNEFTSYW